MSKKPTPTNIEQLRNEYLAMAHAMQSGVAMWIEVGDGQEITRKHLRVGINSAMSDHGALVALLLEKGIITEEEYYIKLIEYMKRERDSYAKKISEKMGGQIVTLA